MSKPALFLQCRFLFIDIRWIKFKVIHVIKWWYLLPLVAFAGCSSTPTELTVDPDDWVYEKRAIKLSIKAPADLNSLSGRPHSLAIGVFQLSDPNTFSGLSVTTEGAVELLQKGQIDETVASFSIINIRPGEQKKVTLNRTQSAQYLGLIVGYYNLNPTNDVKVFPIPLRAQERGLVEKGLAALTLISDEAKAYPDKLNVYIELGRASTRQITDDKLQATQGEDKSKSDIDWIDATRNVEK
jgi:type VI secretion system VasD/TssJ family lipoprotein